MFSLALDLAKQLNVSYFELIEKPYEDVMELIWDYINLMDKKLPTQQQNITQDQSGVIRRPATTDWCY